MTKSVSSLATAAHVAFFFVLASCATSASTAASAPAPVKSGRDPEFHPVADVYVGTLPETTYAVGSEDIYPPEAKRMGLEGSVKAKVGIDETGKVVEVELIERAGHGFDEVAERAMWKLRFNPARTSDGRPVPYRIEYTYNFNLLPPSSKSGGNPGFRPVADVYIGTLPETIYAIGSEDIYPPEARRMGLEGSVKAKVGIDETGKVVEVEIIEPAGHGFDEAAEGAMWKLRFKPAKTRDGRPVPFRIEYTYNFKLLPALSN
jgi:TonB family protein